MKTNQVTADLKPYPAEELNRIKKRLLDQDKEIFDFGTGDPRIPVWQPIREALADAIPEVSQYPSIGGTEVLRDAHVGYLKRRFDLSVSDDLDVIPSGGSKEAVFHAALSLVGRGNGKKLIIYPDPGYPVYGSSTLFAGGTPYPVSLRTDHGFLLEPWDLPEFVQKDAAAIWVNYPHNPTGATAPADYWEKLVTWARETDTVLLSDDCYNDIYMVGEDAPGSPLQFGAEMVLSFMSLSKRSGMTGFRSGMIAGDPELLQSMQRARANMGIATPTFIQSAAAVAWNDDDHVAERRQIFTDRMNVAAPVFQELGLIDEAPKATFYIWSRLPEKFGTGDIKRDCEINIVMHTAPTTPKRAL